MNQQENKISTGQFVASLITAAGIGTDEAAVNYGYAQGWLWEQDVAEQQLPLKKKHCARIVHEFLRLVKKEPDELDSGPAGKLQDLFDCRVCAGHVMQVYTKGIMEGCRNGDGRLIFGMEDEIETSEAALIISRVFEKEKRAAIAVLTDRRSAKNPSAKAQSAEVPEAVQISLEEAHTILQTGKNPLLIDVRPENEYRDGHMKNAVHFPMTELMKNPYAVSDRRDIPILLYCQKGYMSETAAQSLVRAGYESVFYFAWEPEG